MNTRIPARAKPIREGVCCARCGIDAPPETRRPKRSWRCVDCRELECGNGHLWPETPTLDVRGRRRCMLCESSRRRVTRSPIGVAA